MTGDERRWWPVVASGDDVVWVRGFPIASNLRLRDLRQGAGGDSESVPFHHFERARQAASHWASVT